jgi:pyruvate carboxylase
MADPSDRKQIGAPIPGTILSILVEEGETVAKNQAVIIVEAMKMEAKVTAAVEGVVGSIIAKEGQQVKAGQLLISLK